MHYPHPKYKIVEFYLYHDCYIAHIVHMQLLTFAGLINLTSTHRRLARLDKSKVLVQIII